MSGLATERRSSKRMTALLSAMVKQAGASERSKLLNLSCEGALISGPQLVRGAYALLRRNGIEVWGRVEWTNRERSGLKFEAHLPRESLMRPIRNPSPTKIPSMRRPGLKAVPSAEVGPAARSALHLWC